MRGCYQPASGALKATQGREVFAHIVVMPHLHNAQLGTHNLLACVHLMSADYAHS